MTASTSAPPPAAGVTGTGRGRRHRPLWSAVAAVEIVVAATVVVRDVLVPTLVILTLAGVSLLLRRECLATMGFRRWPRPWRDATQVLAATVGWTVLQLALFLPVLERLTGQRQDQSDFASLRGNPGLLLGLLGLSWTLAAIGEELVYRGYLQVRIRDVLGPGTLGVVVGVLASSVLFGLAHTEQGVVGVSATFLDAVFFSLLRLRFRTLWAPVLAHGFNNTMGLVAVFLAGPFYGLW